MSDYGYNTVGENMLMNQVPSNAQWNYGTEGAPTKEAEDVEQHRRSLWRMLDRQLQARTNVRRKLDALK